MQDNLRRGILGIRHTYEDIFQRQRAQLLLRVNLVLAFAWALGLFLVVLPSLFLGGLFLILNTVYVLLAVPLLLVFFLVQRGRLGAATLIYLVMMGSTIIPVALTIDVPALPILLILPLVASGLFLGRRGLLIFLLVLAVGIGVRAVLQSEYTRTVPIVPAETLPRDLVLIVISLGLGAVLLYASNGNAQRVVQLNAREMETLRQISGFRQTLGTDTDENELLLRALRLVQIDLGYTLAQLFVLDELGSYTRLRLAGSDVSGRTVLNRLSVVPGEEGSAVSEAARLLQPVFVNLDSLPARTAHLVPPALAGVTLPLLANGAPFGLLDVQTDEPDTLSMAQQAALNLLAAQIAGALADIRTLAELQRTQREQTETINRYRAQLFEMQQRTQRAIASGWERYIQGRGGEAFGFDVADAQGGALTTTPAADLPADIRRALERGDIYVAPREDGLFAVSVPINYRGDILGAMTFNVRQAITERQADMLRTVAARLGLALENNRLYEQSQAQAARERKAGEITNRLITATDIQSVLNVAAESFNEALGAVRTRVHIEVLPGDDDGAVRALRTPSGEPI